MGKLFDRVTDFDNLRQAAWEVFRGKRGRAAANALFFDLEGRLMALRRQLIARSYRPGPYRTFTIRDPKPRLISSTTRWFG